MVGVFATTPATAEAAEPPPPSQEVTFAAIPSDQSSSTPHSSSPIKPVVSQPDEAPVNDPLASNCYLYIKTRFIPTLPQTRYLVPNSDAQIGAVALFTYPSGLRHYAYVQQVSEGFITIVESNYRAGQYTTRTISIYSASLDGFWMPPLSTPGP